MVTNKRIFVHNHGTSDKFVSEVKKFLSTNTEAIESLMNEEEIEIHLIPNLLKFVDKEFVDIEKIRIISHYMIEEELHFIKGISIFDKILVEEGPHYQLSIIHALCHSILLEKVDPYHFVENYLALKYHREDIALKLIKFVKGDMMPEALKLFEKFYVNLLSVLKHFNTYNHQIENGVLNFLRKEVRCIIDYATSLHPSEKKKIYIITPHLALVSKLNQIDKGELQTLSFFGDNWQQIFDSINTYLEKLLKLKKIIKDLIGITIEILRNYYSSEF